MYFINLTPETALIDNCFHFDRLNNFATAVEPHTHTAYCEILLVRKGVMQHFVNNASLALKENTLIFIRNTDKHYFSTASSQKNTCEWLNFAFHDDILQSMLNFLGKDLFNDTLFTSKFPPQVLLNHFEAEQFANQFKKLHVYNLNPSAETKYNIKLFLFEIITKYFNNVVAKEDTAQEWFHTLISKMMKYENFTAGYSRLLELCPKSKTTLQRIIRKEYEVTLTEFCNNLRLSYIQQQLVGSNAPIIDLILNSGFNNLSYAYNLFKKRYNLSPSAYRKKYRNLKD